VFALNLDSKGEQRLIDLPVSAWFHSHTDPLVTQFMWLITQWHSTVGVLAMAAALGVVLYRAGQSQWLLPLLLAVPGGMLLNVAVKDLVRRPRPHFDDPLLTLTTYSFPSGHTASATVFYAFLCVFLLAQPSARPWRGAIVATAVAMVLLVGLSRIYLGAHYVTDVLGAIVEGMLWVWLSLAVTRALRRRRSGEGA
jgi:membrane-associated phospholipid phosphatase